MRASWCLPCDRQLGIRSVLIVLASGLTFACGKGGDDGGRTVNGGGADAAISSEPAAADDASDVSTTPDDTQPDELSSDEAQSSVGDGGRHDDTTSPVDSESPPAPSAEPTQSTTEPIAPVTSTEDSGLTEPETSDAPSTSSTAPLPAGSAAPPNDSGTPSCNPNDSLECPCPAGQLRCYGVCIDPETDANHCGASDGCELTATPGSACQPLNSVCQGGECVPCSGSNVACANTCIEPAVDQTYCGAGPGCSVDEGTRGDRCRNPELCIEGACFECVVFSGRSAQLPDHAEQLNLGEVNGDTLPDVVTVTGEGGQLLVVLGSDSGEVGEQLTQAFGQNPVAVGLGLLDADAELDVLVGDYTTKQVQVGHGAGDGTFELGSSYTLPGAPRQIVFGDVDGNQTVDAFVLNSDSAQLDLLIGAGDGSFSLAAPIPTPNKIYALALGDLNGDDALDAVAVGLSEAAVVLLGDGDGGFSSEALTIEGTSRAALLADLNGDQQLDLVTGHSAGYNINVAIGNGDGTFAAAYRHNVSENTESYASIVNALAVADFDADEQLDLVVAMNDGISMLWGHQNWAADARWPFTTSGEVTQVTSGDYNGDGVLDLITALYNTNSDFRIYFGSVPDQCPALDAR